MKRNNNNSIQQQIDKTHYENHMRKLLIKIESNTTQILENHIKTYDLGFVCLALLNKSDLQEMSLEKGAWLINKKPEIEELYKKYKAKEALVEPLTYSRTLINLINKGI